jgi:hypothetical protein
MNRQLIQVSFLLTLISCNHPGHYRIDCCNLDPDSKDRNNIYYITNNLGDSASLQAKKDTVLLKRYLRPNEFDKAFDTSVLTMKYNTFRYYKHEFVPIETLFETDKYDAELILLMDKAERHYCFQVRTYNKSGQFISDQNFAVYSDSLKEYFSGDLDKFSKTFTLEWHDKVEKYKFETNGKIIKTEKSCL